MTMRKKYSSILLVCGLGLFYLAISSCKKLNPPETVPCYGHIDSIGMKVITGQGTASAAITCAWVYVDDEPVGAFDLPCTFPMLASGGTHTISIYPGVIVDGMTSTRNKYPFYTYSQKDINITEGGITKFTDTAKYTSSTIFSFQEDFEGPGSIHISKNSGDTGMFKVGAPDAFEGASSGEVVLDSNASMNHISYIGVSDTMTLPHDGTPVFMEINYKSNNLFTMGVFYKDAVTGNYIQRPIWVSAFPTSGWTKMYIDLGPMVANLNGPFMVYFSMVRSYGNPEAKLLLDNIKVLHLKGA